MISEGSLEVQSHRMNTYILNNLLNPLMLKILTIANSLWRGWESGNCSVHMAGTSACPTWSPKPGGFPESLEMLVLMSAGKVATAGWINSACGRREGWEQGWMTFLLLWPPCGSCFQKVLPTLGQVFPHPLKATRIINLQLPTQLLLICGKLALKSTNMASLRFMGQWESQTQPQLSLEKQ